MGITVSHFGSRKPGVGVQPVRTELNPRLPFGKRNPINWWNGKHLPLRKEESSSSDSADEKVKSDSEDPSAGYLNEKVGKSIVVTEEHLAELDGDELEPGGNKVYGTSEDGTKGWREMLPIVENPGDDVQVIENSLSTVTDADLNDESEETDVWQAGERGVVVYLPCKVPYNDSGDEKLYLAWRPFTFDKYGRLFAIGVQHRNIVDVPVAES